MPDLSTRVVSVMMEDVGTDTGADTEADMEADTEADTETVGMVVDDTAKS